MGVSTARRGRAAYRLPAAVRTAATKYRRPEDLSAAQFRRGIEAQMPATVDELPLADQLLANDRTNALVRNRMDRLTPEQRQRSLPAIAQAYQDYLNQQHAARIARDKANADAAKLLGLGVAGAAAFAGRATQEAYDEGYMSPEVDTFELRPPVPDDYYPSPELRSPAVTPPDVEATAMEAMDDIFSAATAEPEINVDPEFAEGLSLMLDGPMFEPVPSVEELVDEGGQLTLSLGDGEDDPIIGGDLGEMEPDLRLSRQAASRDPYMTDAQKRTVQVLMNAGIPEQRAGMIARGEASMSIKEYRNVTGGRR